MNSYAYKAFFPVIIIGIICFWLEFEFGLIQKMEFQSYQINVPKNEMILINKPVQISIQPVTKKTVWILGENVYSDTNSISHTFTSMDEKEICAIIDNQRLIDTTIKVSKPPEPLIINIIASPSTDSILKDSWVIFSAECNKDANFHWTCNDSSSTGIKFPYSFSDTGRYKILLEASDIELNEIKKDSHFIVVYKMKKVEKPKIVTTPKLTVVQRPITISPGQIITLLQNIIDDPENFDDSYKQLYDKLVCGDNIRFDVRNNENVNTYQTLRSYCDYLKSSTNKFQITHIKEKSNCSYEIILTSN